MPVIVSVVLTRCGNVWIRPWRKYCARCWGVSMRGSAGINAFLTSCSPVQSQQRHRVGGWLHYINSVYMSVMFRRLDDILRTTSVATVDRFHML